jgi:outer membrane murein-binding lipoprotein Lpp
MIDELVQGFDAAVFCDLLNEKFAGTFSPVTKPIPVDKDLPWEGADQLGIVKTLPGPNDANMPLVVVAAELPEGEELRERSSRVKQFKFAKKVLDASMANPSPDVEGLISQGLFVFYDDQGNFRLSLVYGKPEGTKLVWSAVRRQSFYVEAGDGNKTFRDRAALPWSTFDQLKDAFSVEKLTKEFYSRLFEWYQWALSDEMGVTYPNDTDTDEDDRQISEHIIRLITRLMFVWFLKQKHLVPDDLFDPGKLKHILKKFDPVAGDNYYRAILQNLFFATLNSEIPERSFATQTGDRTEHFDIKTLYRYPKEFAISEAEVLELFKGIPFLNGGLFECLDRGRNYYDGFSRNRNRAAKVPNRLFFDHDDGLIPLLREYNFTVEENSPGDEEVALDPELLGKVFENLLAAYNPETNVQARKATGSFYTPREIVNYMVDESLIAHLKTRCGDEHEESIRALFAEGERPKDAKLRKAMDEGLVTAKILDPACGSGAFPMGMLLRMVDALRVLRAIPEDDPVYDLKLELIENCIYGADIQCIAVQISKLRFFISLVCEQKPTDDANDNYGIHSLPNLETKFVAANSLVGLPHDGEMLPMQDVEALKKQLWSIRHRHFLARSYQEKKELRKEDRKLRTELAKALELGGGFDTASAKLMAEWDPYDQNTSATFLDPEWMFNVASGFDMVVGNPPYVQIQKLPSGTKERLADQGYSTFSKTADLYCLFYERGGSLLSPAGTLCYITSNKFFRSGYAKPLRRLLTHDYSLNSLIDFGELPVFEAGTDPVITQFGKSRQTTFTAVTIKDYADVQTLPHAIAALGRPITPEALSEDGWSLTGKEEAAILDKMRACGTALGQFVDGEMYRGVLTGFNSAFVLTGEERAALIAADAKSDEIIKPLAKGDDVRKWHIRDKDRWLIVTKIGVDMKRYPAILKHLKQWEPELRKRQDQGNQWWELRACAYYDCFEKPKILFPDLAKESRFTLDRDNYFTTNTTYLIPGENLFLLGFLNSSLLWFYAKNAFSSMGDAEKGGRLRFFTQFVYEIPVPECGDGDRGNVSSLVDRILAAKKNDPSADVSALEAKIDQLVYKLYGLTTEEIAVVEESAARSAASAGRGKMKKADAKKLKKTRKRKANLPPSLPGWD